MLNPLGVEMLKDHVINVITVIFLISVPLGAFIFQESLDAKIGTIAFSLVGFLKMFSSEKWAQYVVYIFVMVVVLRLLTT